MSSTKIPAALIDRPLPALLGGRLASRTRPAQAAKSLVASSAVKTIFEAGPLSILLCAYSGKLLVLNAATFEYNVHPMWNEASAVAARSGSDSLAPDGAGGIRVGVGPDGKRAGCHVAVVRFCHVGFERRRIVEQVCR